MAEKKTGFNLAEALAGVSKLDTGASDREQIEYIDIDRIDDDPNNVYELSGLSELAANIELCGLQQPIRVRTNPDDASRVIIVSGHRRRAAIRQLVADGRDDLREIPCIRERTDGSAALQELRLIYANSDTRKLTSAEISKQAERVEALLYRLKEEGYEFPGRMRDHVAEACKVSKTKLARLKVIRENLTPKMKKAWGNGSLNESAAYTFAQKPIEVQDKAIFHLSNKSYGADPKYWNAATIEDATGYAEKLMALTCKKCGGSCENQDSMLIRLAGGNYWSVACRQGKCCSSCSELVSCKNACPKLADKVKQLRADRKAQRTHDAELQAEKDRPSVEKITSYWKRFGEARAAAGLSVKSWHKAMDIYYSKENADKEYEQKEIGKKIKRDTTLPYGYNFYYSAADRLCKAADRLGCSVDYLLCRTDSPKGIEVAPAKSEQDPCSLCRSAHPGCDKCCNTCDDHCNAWQDCRIDGDAVCATDANAKTGPVWYLNSVEPNVGQEIIAVDGTGYAEDATYLRSGELSGGGMRWDEVTLWTPFPTGATAIPTAEPPAAGWVPLQFINGTEEPPKSGKYYCRFDCDGAIIKQFAWWDGILGAWSFNDGGAKIDAKCLGWFPLPEDADEV